jgi:hypothetical protein
VDQSLGKLAVVDRNWMGLVRELVADAGRYCVYFGRGDGSEIDRFDASVCPPNSFFDFKDTAQFPSQTGASAPPSLPEQQNNEPALLNNQSKSADKQSKQWYDEAPPQTQGEWWNTLKTKGTSKSSTSKSLTGIVSSITMSICMPHHNIYSFHRVIQRHRQHPLRST